MELTTDKQKELYEQGLYLSKLTRNMVIDCNEIKRLVDADSFETDLDGYVKWENDQFERYFTEGDDKTKPIFFVVRDCEKAIAYGGFRRALFDTRVFQIDYINTHPQWSGRGYGTMILERIIAEIVKIGERENNPSTTIILSAAHEAWCARLGFKRFCRANTYTLMYLSLFHYATNARKDKFRVEHTNSIKA